MSANSNELPAASYSSSWPPTRVNLDEIQIFPDLFSSRKRTLASPCLQAGEASTEASDLYIDSSTVPSRVAFKLCSLQIFIVVVGHLGLGSPHSYLSLCLFARMSSTLAAVTSGAAQKTAQATAAIASASASSDPVAPEWLDPGHNAWQMTAGTLVALQSIPGLVVLYAGWVKHKWSINSAFMAFYAFAAVLVCWVVWGYQMAFGTQMLPLVGYPSIAVDMGFELEDSNLPTAGLTQAFPQASMVYFQFVFAAITLILIAGSCLCRMNFIAWMIFVPLWLTFSYTIGAFSIWGGGFLFKYGVIDYSGGYVIHLSSGTAGFVAAWWIGPRLPADRVDAKPSNITLMLVGAGILWTGWNGFNGGDPYAASPDAGAAVLNTNICTATSLLTWTIMDLVFFKKPSVIGAVQGMITGLVAITPAAGVVAGWGAILLGVGSGTVPWVSMNIVGRTKIMRQVDDTLDVFHTHFVGAIVGGVGTGMFTFCVFTDVSC